MDKSMIIGLVVGAAATTTVAGIAGYQISHKSPAYAEVVSAVPVIHMVKIPHQVCKNELVTHRAPVRDRDRLAGTAIGAVVGGLLGNQIGGGSGRTVATVGGAAAGGYAGNRIQKNMQDSTTQTTRQTRCRTEYDSQKKVMGYNVTYRLDDKQSVVHMDYDPGDRIPVNDGQLVLTRPKQPSNNS